MVGAVLLFGGSIVTMGASWNLISGLWRPKELERYRTESLTLLLFAIPAMLIGAHIPF